MSTKICFKCGVEKDLSEFYKHKNMPDGHVNKCKSCNKLDNLKNYQDKMKDPAFAEKERIRHKDKYARLDYKNKQLIWDQNKPWKQTSTYKNLNRKFKLPKGYELHHWNYNDEYLEDVFILSIEAHRKLHTFLEFDLDKRIFKDLEGNYLDTKEKHQAYGLKIGIAM